MRVKMHLVLFFWHFFAQCCSYFRFFSRDENISTKSSSHALLLRFVSPRDPMKSTEESFSSEKCLRGANVFSVSVRHISLPGPGARKCSDILQHSSQLSVLSVISLSLLSGRDVSSLDRALGRPPPIEPGHTALTISYNQQHSFASQNIRRKERKFTVA